MNKKTIIIACVVTILCVAFFGACIYYGSQKPLTEPNATTEVTDVPEVLNEESEPVNYTLTSQTAGVQMTFDVIRTSYDIQSQCSYYITSDYVIWVTDSCTATIITNSDNTVLCTIPYVYIQRTQDLQTGANPQ